MPPLHSLLSALPPARRHSLSGIHGVSFDPSSRRWRVRVTVAGRERTVGRYRGLHAAVDAMVRARAGGVGL
jgi:hypothetical protein